MEERPKYVVIASITSLIGALFALVVIVYEFDMEAENLMMKLGFCLLSMIVFLAICGSLNLNGQWSWRFLIFMGVFCTAVPVVAFLAEAIDFNLCAAMVLISGLTLVFSATVETKRWVESDRI